MLNTIKRLANPNQEMLNFLVILNLKNYYLNNFPFSISIFFSSKLSYFTECEKKIQESLKSSPATNPFMRIVQQSQPTTTNTQTAQSNPFQNIVSQSIPSQQPQFNPFSQIAQPSTVAQPTFQQQPPKVQFASPLTSQSPPQPCFIQQPTQPSTIQFPPGGMFTNLQTQTGGSNPFSSFQQPQQSQTFQMPSTFTSNLTGTHHDYSQLNDLSREELNEYKSNEFTIGRIPVRAPPRELC